MKNAEDKVKRNPYFSDYKEQAKQAKIEYLEKVIEEEKEERNSEKFWGY